MHPTPIVVPTSLLFLTAPILNLILDTLLSKVTGLFQSKNGLLGKVTSFSAAKKSPCSEHPGGGMFMGFICGF